MKFTEYRLHLLSQDGSVLETEFYETPSAAREDAKILTQGGELYDAAIIHVMKWVCPAGQPESFTTEVMQVYGSRQALESGGWVEAGSENY